jgi:OmpA-OmpF porin, OOP family
MKKIFITALVVLSCESMQAQFSHDYLKAADSYYKKGDYYSAAQYYEKWLEATNSKVKQTAYNPYSVSNTATKKKSGAVSSQEEVIYHLAESYRLLHFPAKAAPYYQQALSFDKTQYPLAGYYYGLTLKALEKYEDAEKAFRDFQSGYAQADQYSQAAKREIESLQYISTQLKKKDLHLYSINKAAALNAKGANYAPVWLNATSLLFTSTRIDSAKGKDQSYINRVYEASYNGDALTGIQKTNLPQTADVHQGVISVTPDGNTMFVTRWTINKGQKTAALYSSKKTDKGWSDPVLLGSDINVSGSNSQQPFVTTDGKQLYYASDKPGGQGGFDLWIADLDENGQAVNSRNLGSGINSANDDQAPFYHAASNTLVFSTNGRVGMGGYDFFYSKGTFGKWAEPKNFGYPVNSVKDDIYFTSRGSAKNILEDAILSSDRSSECCLELFALNKQKPLKQVSGIVLNCENQQPLSGINVQVIDPASHAVVTTQTTGADGRYTFTMEEFKNLKAIAASNGYITNELAIATPVDEEAESLSNPALCLNPVPAAIVLENVYYDYNKANLKPESYPSLDKLVEMLQQNPAMVIEIGAHTDNKGTDNYNLKLSEARAQSVIAYLNKKGIEKSRLQAKGYGATQPIASNTNEDGSDNEEGRQ